MDWDGGYEPQWADLVQEITTGKIGLVVSNSDKKNFIIVMTLPELEYMAYFLGEENKVFKNDILFCEGADDNQIDGEGDGGNSLKIKLLLRSPSLQSVTRELIGLSTKSFFIFCKET